MPKKFSGENTKALSAKVRKAAAKEQETAKRVKEVEDALWQENDKNILRKQQRKEEQERKKVEKMEKKAETKALLEEDLKSVGLESKRPCNKITQGQILAEAEKRNLSAQSSSKMETQMDTPLEENINRLKLDEEVAHSVTEALSLLSPKDSQIDKHPERRMKAAFTAFEESNMPRLKAENPTLRLSQLKQLLKKEWMKSSSNPVNQLHKME